MGSRRGERLATKEIQATSSDIMGTMMAAKVHRRQADKIYIFHHHMLKEIAKMQLQIKHVFLKSEHWVWVILT